jgi:DNA repair protein RadD
MAAEDSAVTTVNADRANDPFVRKIFTDWEYGDESLVRQYLALTYGDANGGSREENEEEYPSEEGQLPARQVLTRSHIPSGLFDYQEELAAQIVALAEATAPNNVGLVALPTGGGKTRTALFALMRLLEQGGMVKRALWLAPSRELLDQAFIAFRDLWEKGPLSPDVELLRCHVLKGFPVSSRLCVYFATVQMLASRVNQGIRRLPRFDFVIFDEAHHAEAPSYKDAFVAVRSASGGAKPAVGLSATPGRSGEDKTESLVRLFRQRLLTSAILRPNAVQTLQQRGVLAKLEFRRIEIQTTLVGRVVTIDSALQLTRPFKHLETDRVRFGAILRVTRELASTGRVLVFAGSIAHANAIGLALGRLGVRVGIITSRTPGDQRERVLREFAGGHVEVLVNKSILATGYDCPAIDHVVLTMPIGSPILFEQIVGRASRGSLVGGHETATIWQIDDNLAIHGRPASYHRYRDFDWR